MVAEPYEQFDGTRFYDTPYVREHRARMLRSVQSGSPGFGLHFDTEMKSLLVKQHGLGQATIIYDTTSGHEITTSLVVRGDGRVIQCSQIKSNISQPVEISYSMDFGVSINRASYGQLTEGGPIPIPASENRIETVDGGRTVIVTNPHLGAYLCGRLECNGETLVLGQQIPNEAFIQSPAKGSFSRSFVSEPGSITLLMATFELRPGRYVSSMQVQHGILDSGDARAIWSSPETPGRFIVRRNLEYILGNCAVLLSTTANAVCILTDHVALPLGWMRDN